MSTRKLVGVTTVCAFVIVVVGALATYMTGDPQAAVTSPPDAGMVFLPPPHEDECPVHGEELKADSVKIIYGLLARPRKEYISAMRALFPLARTTVSSGCIRLARKKAPVFYCSTCRANRETWLAKRGVSVYGG